MSWLELATALFDAARATTGLAVNWLIQSTLLVSGGLVIGYLLRKRGSAVQSAVYRTTLVAVLACPLATWTLSLAGISGWSLPMPVTHTHQVTTVSQAAEPPLISAVPNEQPATTSIDSLAANQSVPPLAQTSSQLERDSIPLARAENEVTTVVPDKTIVEEVQSVAIQTAAPAETSVFNVRAFGFVAAAAGALWLAAGGFLLCRLGLAWWKLNCLRRSAWAADGPTLNVCHELAALLDVSPPEVLHSPFLPSPCLAGLRRPAVLLPEAETSLPVRDVLVHELAHLRRHDCWWNLLRRATTALLFFQPLLWKLSRRLDSTAEEVCDDFVVQLGGDRRQYAHRLVDIAELSLAPAAAAGVGIVSLRSMLATRVARIMDTSRSLSTRAGRLLLAVVLVTGLAATLLVGLVGIQPDQAAAESPQTDAGTQETTNDEPENTADNKLADSDTDDLVTVRGRVVDPNGRAVPGADVYALRWFWDFGDRKPLAQVKADGRGRFEILYRKSQFFDAGRPEQWREANITAFADGFGPGWVTYGELKPGEEATLRLVRDDVPIEGRIVDLEGHPIAGAAIEMGYLNASKKEDLSEWLEAVRAGQSISTAFKHLGESMPAFSAGRWQGISTDSDGRFRMTGIGRERQVWIHVKHPTIVTKTLSVVTREMEPLSQPAYDFSRAHDEINYGAQFEFAAAPSRPIEGVIRDAKTREPIAGVEVWSSKFAGENISGISTIKTKTDDQGRYRL
ncbi:MAG TPA: M56 family metallopeptidase, partial [Lacipirellulaceae bacterium]|nr:M56 family metallopeptidase [Lacipirellulaceae bacterium]